MKHEKLIRGVIYDNQDAVEAKTRQTAECLTLLAEEGVNYYEVQYADRVIPSRDEYIASMVLSGLIHPITGDENMIIPSSLIIDDGLYDDLKKIDIGNSLVDKFIDATYEKHSDREKFIEKVGEYASEEFCDENVITIEKINKKTGDTEIFHYDSKTDAITGLAAMFEDGDISEEALKDIISDIIAA